MKVAAASSAAWIPAHPKTDPGRTKISSVPLLGPLDFVRRRTGLPAPLLGRPVSFWHSGRTAIYQAIADLDLPPGSAALLPAYACGSEYDAVLKAGLDVRFYRLNAAMEPDLDHLASIIGDNARLIYVTHYFGFAQPMDAITALARSRDLLVLEDCAMALYSRDADGRPLGTMGDVSVFSFMKSIVVPDGGAHLLNRADLQGTGRRRRPSSRPGIRPIAGSLKHQMEMKALHGSPRLVQPAKRILDVLIDATKPSSVPRMPTVRRSDDDAAYRRAVMDLIVLKPSRFGWEMSSVARHLFERVPHDRVRERRRANYAALADHLPPIEGIRPMFPALPAGCCPLFFPLIVDDPDPLHRYLTSRGIDTKRTWSYFHDGMRHTPFPRESWLKNHVIALPVHHQLGEEDMLYIAEQLMLWQTREPAASSTPRR